MSEEQCCGNCGWWRDLGLGCGSCLFNVTLPDSYCIETVSMCDDEGTTCPCWKPKEDSDDA